MSIKNLAQELSPYAIGNHWNGATLYDEPRIIDLKNSGIGLGEIHRKTGIAKSTLSRMFKRHGIKTRGYKKRAWLMQGKSLESLKFRFESEMRRTAIQYIRARHPNKEIKQEQQIFKFEWLQNKGFYADFVVEEDDTIYEMKRTIATRQAQMLLGQLCCYVAAGYKAVAILPDDVYLPEYLKKALGVIGAQTILI